MIRLKLGCVAVALVGSALPVSAQDLCGGVGTGAEWIGETEDLSDLSTAPQHLEQLALALGGKDYVALFKLSQATEVRLEAQGRGIGDPLIELRDASGEILLTDDDSGGETSSRGEIALEPGTFCLSVRSYDGNPMTGFVRIGRTEHEPLTTGMEIGTDPPGTPDPVAACATPQAKLSDEAVDSRLADGISVTASAQETPSWGFQLDTAAAISITAENSDADPQITLLDASGAVVAENDDFDGLNSRIDVISELAPGDYCVAVNALSDPSRLITITLSGYDPEAALRSMIDRGEASPPLDGNHPITNLGVLGQRMRQDVRTTDAASWFAFDIAETGLVMIEAVANGTGDPILFLYDDFGRLVDQNDDHGQSLDSLISARVQPGTYLVGVRQLDEGQRALVRLLFERFVPAK